MLFNQRFVFKIDRPHAPQTPEGDETNDKGVEKAKDDKKPTPRKKPELKRSVKDTMYAIKNIEDIYTTILIETEYPDELKNKMGQLKGIFEPLATRGYTKISGIYNDNGAMIGFSMMHPQTGDVRHFQLVDRIEAETEDEEEKPENFVEIYGIEAAQDPYMGDDEEALKYFHNVINETITQEQKEGARYIGQLGKTADTLVFERPDGTRYGLDYIPEPMGMFVPSETSSEYDQREIDEL